MPNDLTFEWLDHTGDAGFVATAPTLQRLFTGCAERMVRVCCPEGPIRRIVARPVTTEGADLVELLVNWLSDINSLGSLHHELYDTAAVTELTQAKGAWRICGHVEGEPIDRERHRLACEIKAVTYHQAEVVEQTGRWRARVIFDL